MRGPADTRTNHDKYRRRTDGVSLSRQQRPESVRDQLRQLGHAHTQVEAEQATACVRAALEAGITTFDTADTYANGRAETILGDALAGERRESLEILTKVFGATGPGGPNDSGLSRKHIHESINASLTRLQTDYVDLYQAHRYDFSTPLEETMEAFADVVRAGKALYIGVSEWTPEQLRAGHALARELKIPFVSNQSKYNALFRVIEPEVVPTCQELGIGQICFSPIEQGILTGKYKPGQPGPTGFSRHRRSWRGVHQGPVDRRAPDPRSTARASG